MRRHYVFMFLNIANFTFETWLRWFLIFSKLCVEMICIYFHNVLLYLLFTIGFPPSEHWMCTVAKWNDVNELKQKESFVLLYFIKMLHRKVYLQSATCLGCETIENVIIYSYWEVSTSLTITYIQQLHIYFECFETYNLNSQNGGFSFLFKLACAKGL